MLTHFAVELSSSTIGYVDPDIAGKRVCEDNTQLIWWHWPGDDESILPKVTSIIDTTILFIVNAAIGGLPDSSKNIRELWGTREEHNGEGDPHTRNASPICDSHSSAGCVKSAIKLNNPRLFWVVYCGQQADGTSGDQTPVPGGRSYHVVDDILPTSAEDMIDDMGDQSDHIAEIRCPNLWSFRKMKTGFEKSKSNLQRSIIGPQQYLEVIRNRDLGLFANCE